jgi:uncharacterized protein YpmB|tara:strand:+ start:44 stop:496 length:453 start_codon:yes stop_codon:yes gene_type:complete
MNFFKNILILIFLLTASFAYADNHDQNQTTTENEQVNEIAQEIQDDEEVPLNDPFAGNEGTNSLTNVPEGEQDEPMSIYNYKLLGLISGKDHSYISLGDTAGEVITLTIGQNLGKIKLVDLRLTEAIFEKEDETFLIIDFNNQIRETNEY